MKKTQARTALAALRADTAQDWRQARRKRETLSRLERVALKPRRRRMTRAELEALPF
jgi:hypothetical protein